MEYKHHVSSFLIFVSTLTAITLGFFGWPTFTHYQPVLLAEQKTEVSPAVKPVPVPPEESVINQILFVGDVMLGRNVEYLMEKNGYDYPYRGYNLRSDFGDFYLVGNFESAIAVEHRRTKSFKMIFSVNQLMLPEAQNYGFTHFSLANNHTYDYGSVGFSNTVATLEANNFAIFGHPKQVTEGKVSYLEVADSTVALIGIHALERLPTKEELDQIFFEADIYSDYQVVFIHWGNEYELESSVTQRLLAKQLVQAGADLIIGHHPHVVQEVALVDDVLVFYSLGNYIFDQYFSEDVQTGLLLRLVFAESTSPRIEILPVSSSGILSQPYKMADDKARAFLEQLADRSHESLSDGIRQGALPVWIEVASSEKIAIMRRNN